jgi:hypothetical protein
MPARLTVVLSIALLAFGCLVALDATDVSAKGCANTRAAGYRAVNIRASQPVHCQTARTVIRRWFRSGFRSYPGFLVNGDAWSCGFDAPRQAFCIGGLHGWIRFGVRRIR